MIDTNNPNQEPDQEAAPEPVREPEQPAQAPAPQVQTKPESETQTPEQTSGSENSNIPPTKKADPKDVQDNKPWAVISYLWILCFVTLFGKKDSKFAQFHAKQGVVLFALWIAIYIVARLLMMISLTLGNLVMSLGSLAILVLAILGIMHALNGNLEKLPFIGQYANKINI